MLKKLTKRHRLTALPLLFVMGGVVMPGPSTAPNDTVPPTAPIVKQVVVVERGVRVEWLPSQAGTHPLGGYVVEKRHEHQDFKAIGEVSGASHVYLDTEGRADDTYRVRAQDNQQPPKRSPPGQAATVAVASPGESIRAVAIAGAPAGETALSGAATPEAKAGVLHQLMSENFRQLNASLASGDHKGAVIQLTAIQDYQQQVLAMLASLPAPQRQTLGKLCMDQFATLKTDLYLLPEADRIDAMVVLGGCTAMQENLP